MVANQEIFRSAVRILYQYLQKGFLIADIVNDKKFSLDNSGRLTKWGKGRRCKSCQQETKEAFLRFDFR